MGLNLNKYKKMETIERCDAVALAKERNYHRKASADDMNKSDRIDRVLKKFGAQVEGDILTFDGKEIDLKG